MEYNVDKCKLIILGRKFKSPIYNEWGRARRMGMDLGIFRFEKDVGGVIPNA